MRILNEGLLTLCEDHEVQRETDRQTEKERKRDLQQNRWRRELATRISILPFRQTRDIELKKIASTAGVNLVSVFFRPNKERVTPNSHTLFGRDAPSPSPDDVTHASRFFLFSGFL